MADKKDVEQEIKDDAPEKKEGPPPNQNYIPKILRWGVEHPGIQYTLPTISKDEWQLTVEGEVEMSLSLSWEEFM